MGDPQGGPFDYGGPRTHDWSIEDIDWDPSEVRGEPRRPPQQPARAAAGGEGAGAGAQQQPQQQQQAAGQAAAQEEPQQQGQALLRRQPSGVGSVASEGAAASGGASGGGGGEVPVILDATQSQGAHKRRMPMTCQVDGCKKDLSVEKEYYQRYRICEEHLKLSSLLKDGLQQRFCQQCGRFHLLADFDGDKRSCRARLDLHNNRRRKRGDGSEGFRGSARLDKRLAELGTRVSPRQRARRGARGRRASQHSPGYSDEEMSESSGQEGAAGRGAARPGSPGGGEDEPERERRYATRQATAARRRTSYNPALDLEKLYPPNIAQTLAALQRGAAQHEGVQQPLLAPSRFSLQEGLTWEGRGGGGGEGAKGPPSAAELMLRHLSDPVQGRESMRQSSGTGIDMRRNELLVNSLSSPSYLPSGATTGSGGPGGGGGGGGGGEGGALGAAETSPEQELQDFIARNPELFQQPDLGGIAGSPFSEALVNLNHYTAQLLYKCASDPSSAGAQAAAGAPRLPPATLAGLHSTLGGAFSRNGLDPAEERIISYSSEPAASSGLAKFPSEPFARTKQLLPQYSAFDIPDPAAAFPDVSWEHLSYRQGPTKHFFESAEGAAGRGHSLGRQAEPHPTSALVGGEGAAQQQQQGGGGMDPAGSAGAALEAARLLGGAGGGHMQHPSGLLMNPLLSLAHSSGGSQGLARMTSQEEAAASMRREPSSELRMGGVSLADLMQQRRSFERQASGEWRAPGAGGEPGRRAGALAGEGSLLRPGSRLERLPSAATLQQIPEHAAAAEAHLGAQDILAGRGQGGAVSDIYSVFNFGSHPGAAQAPLLPPLDPQGAQQQQQQQQAAAQAASHGALEPFPGLQAWGEQAAAAAQRQQQQQQQGGGPPPGSPLPQGMAAAMLAASPPGARHAHPGEGSAWVSSVFASPPTGAGGAGASGTTPPPLPGAPDEAALPAGGAARGSWFTPLLSQQAGLSPGLPSSMGDAGAQQQCEGGSGRPLPAYPLGPPAGSPEAAAAAAAEVGALMRSSGRARTATTPEPAQLTPRSGEPLARERKEELSAVSAAAAQAAWRSHGELLAAQAPLPKRAPAMLPPAPARLSAKLDAAVGADLAGGGLREDLEQALGGAENVARLEAAARPGCVHLVADVRLRQGAAWDSEEAIAAAVCALKSSGGPLWRCGRVLLQLGCAGAAELQDGAIQRLWLGEELRAELPQAPCAAPLAAAPGEALPLRLRRSFVAGVRSSSSPGRPPTRLLARRRGRFVADIDLSALLAGQALQPHKVKIVPLPVDVDLGGSTSDGLIWLDTERGGFVSRSVPVVLCADVDVVDEVRKLQREIVRGRCSWEACCGLLADIGLLLEYAQLICDRAQALDAYRLCYLPHAACLARARLALLCAMGWPALTAKVLPLAAVGCTDLRQLLALAQAHMQPGAGSLLHAAVRSGSLSMATVLLDLASQGGFEWDLAEAAGPQRESALHLAANLDDGGRMAGLLLAHAACPAAAALWAAHKDAGGCTPADIAFSASKARQGRLFLPLSPSERAAVADCSVAASNRMARLERASSLDSSGTATRASSAALPESCPSRAASSLPLPDDHAWPARTPPPLPASAPLDVPTAPLPQISSPSYRSASLDSLMSGSGRGACLAGGTEEELLGSCGSSPVRVQLHADDRIIRKSLSAEAGAQSVPKRVWKAVAAAPEAAAAAQSGAVLHAEGVPWELPVEVAGIPPEVVEMLSTRQASSSSAVDRRLLLMRGEHGAGSAGAAGDASAEQVGAMQPCSKDEAGGRARSDDMHPRQRMHLPGASSSAASAGGAEEESARRTRPHFEPSAAAADAAALISSSGAAAGPGPGNTNARSPALRGQRGSALEGCAEWALTLALLAPVVAAALAAAIVPAAATLCMLGACMAVVLAWKLLSLQTSPAPAAKSAGSAAGADKPRAQALHHSWRCWPCLRFKSPQLERQYLESHAGGRWQLDVLVSVLFTALAAFLFVAGLPVFASPAAAAPWAAHILCAAMPALLALPRRSWYARHRERIMLASRLGCQLCALACSLSAATAAPSKGGGSAAAAIGDALLCEGAVLLLSDLLTASLQFLHLPVGFQVRTWLQLPLALLALRVRLRARPILASWRQALLLAAAMLAPAGALAALEQRSRRCFLTAPPTSPTPAAATSHT